MLFLYFEQERSEFDFILFISPFLLSKIYVFTFLWFQELLSQKVFCQVKKKSKIDSKIPFPPLTSDIKESKKV